MNNRRLLILDDDAFVGRTVEFMAGSLGLEHRAVSSPGAFFEQLETWEPDYILLDLLMPEMDGVQILQRLAERGCGAAIIISSGVDSRVLDAALRAATEHALYVAGSLSKPFIAAQLGAIITKADTVRAAQQRRVEAPTQAAVTEADLRRAVEGNQFELAYQPKIACATGVLIGFEALVRWRHPELGVIMPDRFIPLSETAGLIDPLTDLVMQQALGWIASATASGALSLAVNVSAKSLARADLADRLAGWCRELSFSPERVTLELTETAAMEDPVLALGMMTRLRMKGFELSIDDFGTGYSSMQQLSRLPFSEIKIDKSFVMTAPESPDSRAIISSTVDLAHRLGLRAVAEGVEDGATLEYLQQIGCDIVQGFFIARPMAGTAVARWISEWKGWISN